MRRLARIILTLFCVTALPLVQANPILEGFLNELFFPPGSWVLEMHAHPPNLDGWSLTARSGASAFKSGIVLNMGYVLVTPDSLLAPLPIDPLGDSLTLQSPVGVMSGLIFGAGGNSAVIAPDSGQSICLHETESYYYLDNSPTLGTRNDALNATAILTGYVKDSLTAVPIPGVRVASLGDSARTDVNGHFEISLYARTAFIGFSHPNYAARWLTVVFRPEQTVTLQIALMSINAVPESRRPERISISQNYPNPFNPSTTVVYNLPSASRVTLVVYNALGERIVELLRGVRPPGKYVARWNGKDEDDRPLPSGVYLARFHAADLMEGTVYTRAIKLLLLR